MSTFLGPSALTLPPELKCYIAAFCILSTLASLAQVHTSYQAAAERILYRHVAIRTKSNNLLLNTLKSFPHKALLVRSLTVEFPLCSLDISGDVFAMATCLCEALCHMQALIDLRIRLPVQGNDALKTLMNHALRKNNFQLRTLHCNEYLDIAGIILGHSELQTIGIYSHGSFHSLVVTLEEAQAASELHPLKPTIFALERDTYLPVYNNISIVPAFSENKVYPWRAIADSCDSDVAKDIQLQKSYISGVFIYLRDFSDMASLRLLVQEITENCPELCEIVFFLQKLTQQSTDHPDLLSILSLVPHLREVVFGNWQTTKSLPWIPNKLARANAWSCKCPNLRVIAFPDGYSIFRGEKQGSNWRIKPVTSSFWL